MMLSRRRATAPASAASSRIQPLRLLAHNAGRAPLAAGNSGFWLGGIETGRRENGQQPTCSKPLFESLLRIHLLGDSNPDDVELLKDPPSSRQSEIIRLENPACQEFFAHTKKIFRSRPNLHCSHLLRIQSFTAVAPAACREMAKRISRKPKRNRRRISGAENWRFNI
jgi:hypothetical protein